MEIPGTPGLKSYWGENGQRCSVIETVGILMYRYRLGHHGVAEMLLNVQSEALFIWQVYSEYVVLLIITLHCELWEGLLILFPLLILEYLGTQGLINFICFKTSHNNTPSKVSTIDIYRKKWIRSILASRKRSPIWVYDITKSPDNPNCLVKGAPFKTKTESANVLKTTRFSVALYLDRSEEHTS